jgi:hypothetical protein
VVVEYIAGYSPSSDSPTDYAANVPSSIKAAMKLVIGCLYQNRSPEESPRSSGVIKRLLAPYEIRDLTLESMRKYWTAPELWPGSAFVIVAGGPSLTPEQVAACHGRTMFGSKVRMIVVNDGYRIAPWADVLYFCDCKWWKWHAKHLGNWGGLIVRLDGGEYNFKDERIQVMRNIDTTASASSATACAPGATPATRRSTWPCTWARSGSCCSASTCTRRSARTA